MKISVIKLKGRGYLIGNLRLILLVIVTSVMFFICLNVLPEASGQLFKDRGERLMSLATVSVCFGVIVLAFAVLSAVGMGIDRFFLRKAERKGGKVKDLFYYFRPSEVFRLILFSLRTGLIKTVSFSVCFAPSFACFLFIRSMLKTTASLNVSAVMLVAFLLLFINGCFYYSEISTSLFLVKYLFIEGEYLNFRQLIASSQNRMKPYRNKLIKLKMSFFGWFISCLLVLPVGYVLAYYRQSMAVAAAEFMAE